MVRAREPEQPLGHLPAPLDQGTGRPGRRSRGLLDSRAARPRPAELPSATSTSASELGHEIRTVDIDLERAPLVQWAFETYATGEWSVKQLTAALEERGLTTVPTTHWSEK